MYIKYYRMAKQTNGLPRPRKDDLVYDETKEDNKNKEEEEGKSLI